jgi:hypothetical protein
MVELAMHFQNYGANYTVQKRKKIDIVAYLGDEPTIGDVEPSYILVLFPLLFL